MGPRRGGSRHGRAPSGRVHRPRRRQVRSPCRGRHRGRRHRRPDPRRAAGRLDPPARHGARPGRGPSSFRGPTSMPGIGVRTAARILTEVVGKDFADAGHLASYAGIVPAARPTGTSIRGEHAPRGGNKRPRRALFLSAFASLHHTPSRAYYDRKRAPGERHHQAIIAFDPPPDRRALRHAAPRRSLPRPHRATGSVTGSPGRLTKTIEAPPQGPTRRPQLGGRSGTAPPRPASTGACQGTGRRPTPAVGPATCVDRSLLRRPVPAAGTGASPGGDNALLSALASTR